MAGYCSFKHIEDLQEDINPKVKYCLEKVNDFSKQTTEFSNMVNRFDEILLLKASKLSVDEVKAIIDNKPDFDEIEKLDVKFENKFDDFVEDLFSIYKKINLIEQNVSDSMKSQIFEILGDKPIEIEDDKVNSDYVDERVKDKAEYKHIKNYDGAIGTINRQLQHLVVIIQKSMDKESQKSLSNISTQLRSIQNWVCNFDVCNPCGIVNSFHHSAALNTNLINLESKEEKSCNQKYSNLNIMLDQNPNQYFNDDINQDLQSPRIICKFPTDKQNNLLISTKENINKAHKSVRNESNINKLRSRARMNREKLQSQLNVSMNELTDRNSDRSCLKAFPINHFFKDYTSKIYQAKTPIGAKPDVHDISVGIDGLMQQNSVRKSVDDKSYLLRKKSKAQLKAKVSNNATPKRIIAVEINKAPGLSILRNSYDTRISSRRTKSNIANHS